LIQKVKNKKSKKSNHHTVTLFSLFLLLNQLFLKVEFFIFESTFSKS